MQGVDNGNFGAFVDYLQQFPINKTIQDAMLVCYDKVHGCLLSDGNTYNQYKTVAVSVSGGADSDIVVDMVERVGYPVSDVRYVFFDTGMEYQATRRHLDFLEEKYNIKIERYKAKTPVPLAVKKYGVPFLSKRVSDMIHRLQINGFCWEDEPYDILMGKYPNCKSGIVWWCGMFSTAIQRNKWLKEFLMQNPPTFSISDRCCTVSKKKTAEDVEKKMDADLSIVGVRKSEGGIRSLVLHSCFDGTDNGPDVFRPVFWLVDADKKTYESCFCVKHSDCYTKYGFRRTGCACCPFGREFEEELQVVKLHEPNLYKAAVGVFGESYDYTRKYREFAAEMDRKKKYGGQVFIE